MYLPTPFIFRSDLLPSAPAPLIVVGYPMPSPDNPKEMWERRVVLGLGRQRDARVVSVAAALFYIDPSSFYEVTGMASFSGRLHVFHGIEGANFAARIAKLRASAKTAMSRGLFGDVWDVALYDGYVHDSESEAPPAPPAGLTAAIDAARTLFCGTERPWPKDAWTVLGGTP